MICLGAFQVFSGAYRDLCRNTLVFGGQKAYHQQAKHTRNLSTTALMTKAKLVWNFGIIKTYYAKWKLKI